MKRMTFLKKLGFAFLAIIVLLVLIQYPIFRCKSEIENTVFENNKDSNVYLLKYNYTTGAGWFVINSTDKNLVNKHVALYTVFDPRYLKDNEEFDLDYKALILVEAKKMRSKIIDATNTPVLVADEVTIIGSTRQTNYSILDMSMEGIVKSFFGIFNKNYWLSY